MYAPFQAVARNYSGMAENEWQIAPTVFEVRLHCRSTHLADFVEIEIGYFRD